jgi:hypothetical protein
MWKLLAVVVVVTAFAMLCVDVVDKWHTELARIDTGYHAAVARVQADHRERVARIVSDYGTDGTQAQPDAMMARNVEKLAGLALREIERARASITSTGCNKPAVVTRAISAIIEFDGIINGGVLDSRVQAAIDVHVAGVVVKTENLNFVNNVLTVTMSLTFPLAA